MKLGLFVSRSRSLGCRLSLALLLTLDLAHAAWAQNAPTDAGESAPPGSPPFFGPGGFGPGGPPGMQETKLVKKFDADGDRRLNKEERQAARQFLTQQRSNRGAFGPGGVPGGFGPHARNETPARPGPKVSPADVKSFPDAPVFDELTLRTFFLEFENADWEKELADFTNTDVEVPARLTVDGKTFQDVGVHFRGASSYMMVSEGHKRSLNLSLDWMHAGQNFGGQRTLNLLNAHEDPTFLRTVLYFHIAREYLPAPRANFVKVVINGEYWGVYVSQEQFNKDFVNERFGTSKGARWKTPGSPHGSAGLTYLGNDASAYKSIYDIKTKDDPEIWAELIRLCKVLNQTPSEQLEQALEPLLDVDGVLRFLALENVLANNDGYWTRASDYSLYLDPRGRFYIFPYDANESFSSGGGPGPGDPGGFGPGPAMLVGPQMLNQADKDGDGKLTKAEFTALASVWFGKLDSEKKGKVSRDQLVEKFDEILPPPQGFRPPGFGPPSGRAQGTQAMQRPGGGRGGGGPAMFLGPALFTAMDADKDGALTRQELSDTFAKWHHEWDTNNGGSLDADQLREGLAAVLPKPNFGGPGAGPGGPGGGRPGGRPGLGGPDGASAELDPLVAVKDESKPLLSKLLAVPSLRARYLGYVREIAETWLDWNKLGPLAKQYQALIADAVKADTRKLDSTEAFLNGVDGAASLQTATRRPGAPQQLSLKSFAEKRRAFLLSHPAMTQATQRTASTP